MINIQLSKELLPGKRSLDKVIRSAILTALKDDLQVYDKTGRRMNRSFRNILEDAKDFVVKLTPGKTLPTGWVIKSSRKSGEVVYTLENTKSIRRYAPTNNVVDLIEVFEYGTGLHGKRGAKYPIVAKAAPELDFFYQSKINGAWERYQGKGPVWHPGVKAVGMVRRGRAKLERDSLKNLKKLESRINQNIQGFVDNLPEAGR